MPPSMRRMWHGPITSSPCGLPASSTASQSLTPFLLRVVQVDLEAELGRVAGARDEHLHSVELVRAQVVVRDLEDAVAEQVDHHVLRLRPLHLHRPDVDLLDRHVVARLVGDAARPQLHVAVGEREPEAVLLHAQQDGVVDDPAVGQAEEDVLALLDRALVQVARHEQVGELERVRPADLDLALHADVPQGDPVQQVPVLLDRVAVVPRVVGVVVDAVHLRCRGGATRRSTATCGVANRAGSPGCSFTCAKGSPPGSSGGRRAAAARSRSLRAR